MQVNPSCNAPSASESFWVKSDSTNNLQEVYSVVCLLLDKVGIVGRHSEPLQHAAAAVLQRMHPDAFLQVNPQVCPHDPIVSEVASELVVVQFGYGGYATV